MSHNDYAGPYPLNKEQTQTIMGAFKEGFLDEEMATHFLTLDGANAAREYLAKCEAIENE